MFKFIFLLGICRASASSSTQSTQAVLSSIQEGLSQIGEDGSTRQIAINALMRSVKSSTQINSTQNETLERVVTLVEDVKLSLLNQTIANQDTMNTYESDLENCNSYYSTQVSSHEKEVNDEVSDYTTERETFYESYETYREKCDRVKDLLTGLTTTAQNAAVGDQDDGHVGSVTTITLSTACLIPTADVDNVVSWTNKLAKVKHWFADVKATWDTESEACKTAESDFRAKESSTVLTRNAVHTKMCYMRNTWVSMCNGRDLCWDNTENATTLSQITGIGDKSQRLARMIDFVICLVRKLQKEEADSARDTCSTTDSTGSECSCILLRPLAVGLYENLTTTPVNPPTEVRCNEATAGGKDWLLDDDIFTQWENTYDADYDGSAATGQDAYTNGVVDATKPKGGVHSGPFGKWSSTLTYDYDNHDFRVHFDNGHHMSQGDHALCQN